MFEDSEFGVGLIQNAARAGTEAIAIAIGTRNGLHSLVSSTLAPTEIICFISRSFLCRREVTIASHADYSAQARADKRLRLPVGLLGESRELKRFTLQGCVSLRLPLQPSRGWQASRVPLHRQAGHRCGTAGRSRRPRYVILNARLLQN